MFDSEATLAWPAQQRQGGGGSRPSLPLPLSHQTLPVVPRLPLRRITAGQCENEMMCCPLLPGLALLAAALLGGMTAAAQPASEKIEAPAQRQKHVYNYGEMDSTCTRWTDQCRTCARTGEKDSACSNIGIACQPAEVECTERKQADDVKK